MMSTQHAVPQLRGWPCAERAAPRAPSGPQQYNGLRNDGPSQRGPPRLPLSNMAVDLPSCQRAPALSTCPAPHTRPPAISPTELAVLTPKSRLCNMETPRHRSTAPHEAVHRLRLCTT